MKKEQKRSTTYWNTRLRLVRNVILGVISLIVFLLWLIFDRDSLFSLKTLGYAVALVVVSLLIGRLTRENREVKKGFTDLMYFSANGKKWDVIDLLDKGADLNQQDAVGGTALIYAARNGQQEIVRILLERGANRSLQTHAGKSAAEIARANGYHVIAEQIEGYVEGQVS